MIKVVETVFDVFELLAGSPERSFSSSDIAKRLQLNNTTCNNILRTMVYHNYLEQDGVRAGYRLGPMTFRIGTCIHYQEALLRAVKPYAERFTERTGESSNLVILRNNTRFMLYTVHGNQPIQASSEIRKDDKLYVSATARTLMAYVDARAIKHILKRNGAPTEEEWPEAYGRLEEELAVIRKRGYGLAVGVVPEIAGGATPVFQRGEVVGVLGYWLPMIRYSQELEIRLIAELKDACAAISAILG